MSNETERQRGLWVALRHQAQGKGFRVVVRSMDSSVAAYSDYGARLVVISDRLSPLGALARLAHEVGHVYLHADHQHPSAFPDRGVREIEAELFAYAVLLHNGITPDDSLLHYMTNWAMRVAPQAPEQLVEAVSERLAPAVTEFSAQVHCYVRDQMQAARWHAGEQAIVAPDHDGPEL
ncbi:ImmA/IrrE family metallo-endopeptidase [Kribbella sp. NBC_01505]|uniref:ImmA/IrrE family metallo-endopeptidase n=1 Tax=Kribbella sp. NBC_01505 TaxID=2903580 RepID=UPI00386B2F84